MLVSEASREGKSGDSQRRALGEPGSRKGGGLQNKTQKPNQINQQNIQEPLMEIVSKSRKVYANMQPQKAKIWKDKYIRPSLQRMCTTKQQNTQPAVANPVPI